MKDSKCFRSLKSGLHFRLFNWLIIKFEMCIAALIYANLIVHFNTIASGYRLTTKIYFFINLCSL